MTMDFTELGAFLKTRRARVSPQEAGLPPGSRRRVPGLRRDEVARLADISVDYYIELEQGRRQAPSVAVLKALAIALRLDATETEYLMHLAGHPAPLGGDTLRMQSTLQHLLEQLQDTPALVITDLYEVVMQNRACQVLVGPHRVRSGRGASFVYQWFTNTGVRRVYPQDDHAFHSQRMVADLHTAAARRGPQDQAVRVVVKALLVESREFATLWADHQIAICHEGRKRIVNPVLGVVEVQWNSFFTADAAQRLMWMTPVDSTVSQRLAELDPHEVWQKTPAPAEPVSTAAAVQAS
ncbi:helix-turn-helix transcriptional regulator [Streptomyces sp. NPDC102259]|uniref:helix-turn-helix transcriptional regulator n=1 Tax=Streptomyces sp. NPDC102259 TaxID=3366148 RepID=UPI0038208B4A